jgi:hypothetical protein
LELNERGLKGHMNMVQRAFESNEVKEEPKVDEPIELNDIKKEPTVLDFMRDVLKEVKEEPKVVELNEIKEALSAPKVDDDNLKMKEWIQKKKHLNLDEIEYPCIILKKRKIFIDQ